MQDSGITHLLAQNASAWTGSGTNTYVIASRSGPSAVVDPGTEAEAHLAAIIRAAARSGPLCAILVTHGHPDHIGGVARLRALTGAPIFMSSAADLAGEAGAAPPADVALEDGAVVPVGERPVRALHTPGHRFDHLSFLLEDTRTLFAGDMVAGTGTVVIAPPEGDLGAYLDSLRRLRALDLRLILPGHGPPVDAPRAKLDEYLGHRQMREDQVLAGLAAGADTVDALVARIYADLDPALREAAALSVLAHLIKLEREGRAARAGTAAGMDVWRRVP